MNKKNILITALFAALVTTPSLAAIDVSDVSTEIVAQGAAILAIGSLVIAAGMSLGAVKNAARWAAGLFKIFMRG